jgi:S-disulfanyl-L-cysteine oxidoreductase SoxD
MFTLEKLVVGALALTLLAAGASLSGEGPRYGLGKKIAEHDLAAWDIDVRPDGAGLPPGRGSVAQGKEIYLAKCSACHGESGEGSPMDRLAGGQGTLATAKPVKTIGSYWPYATTLFDYVRRTMPFTAPQTLGNDDVYALTAYLLSLNGILANDAVLDAKTLPRVEMPNRKNFVPDPRPDVK